MKMVTPQVILEWKIHNHNFLTTLVGFTPTKFISMRTTGLEVANLKVGSIIDSVPNDNTYH